MAEEIDVWRGANQFLNAKGEGAEAKVERQCGERTLRRLVTPGSVFLPLRAKTGEGMPQRAMASSRPPCRLRTIGAQ